MLISITVESLPFSPEISNSPLKFIFLLVLLFKLQKLSSIISKYIIKLKNCIAKKIRQYNFPGLSFIKSIKILANFDK